MPQQRDDAQGSEPANARGDAGAGDGGAKSWAAVTKGKQRAAQQQQQVEGVEGVEKEQEQGAGGQQEGKQENKAPVTESS